jgi:acylphosphatase
LQLQITGIVQGVGYRESMRAVAQQLGITGWVRNRADGSVEAMAQGDAHDVERLVAWCHDGPPNAAVRAVKAIRVETDESFSTFARRPSA